MFNQLGFVFEMGIEVGGIGIKVDIKGLVSGFSYKVFWGCFK